MQTMKVTLRNAQNPVDVLQVHNLIKARPDSNISQDKITSNVREAIIHDPFTESYQIDLLVNNHVVYLEGKMDSYFEKAEAEAENTAFSTKGVADVHDNLKMRHPTTQNDAPYVCSRFIYSDPWHEVFTLVPSSDDQDIRVHVKDELRW